jgi:hypothetical protein
MQIAIDSCALIYPTLSVHRNHYFRPAARLPRTPWPVAGFILALRLEQRFSTKLSLNALCRTKRRMSCRCGGVARADPIGKYVQGENTIANVENS